MGKPTDSVLLRMLVVDDDALWLRALVRLLSSRGDVTAVGSLAAADQALAAHRFDAVVSDLELGDGSGMSVLLLARERQPAARRILLTGAVTSDEHERLATVIGKPGTEALIAAIESAAVRLG